MQLTGVVFLLLTAFAAASLNDNGIEGGDRVMLVAPVLAPPKDSRTHVTTRSRQFPILVLLSQDNPVQPEAKALPVNPEPVYVQKLEDQVNARPERKIREKRTLKKGGRGGGGVFYVPISNGGGGRFNSGCHGTGGYPQNGAYPYRGNYGGGGNGVAIATAVANSSGKR